MTSGTIAVFGVQHRVLVVALRGRLGGFCFFVLNHRFSSLGILGV